MRFVPALALLSCLSSSVRPTVLAATSPDTTSSSGSRHALAWGAATAAALGTAALLDRHIEEENDESHSGTARDLARAVQPFGNAVEVGAGIALTYGAARLLHRSELTRAMIRIGAADAVAGLGALALKQATGRARPHDSPGDPWRFRPFSGSESFPSGHATVAFATAVAVDRETRAHWVPWVVYPLATLVGWSRVHDDEHWTSDVVAGAALGAWTSWSAERRLHRGLGFLERFAWQVRREAGGLALQVSVRER